MQIERDQMKNGQQLRKFFTLVGYFRKKRWRHFQNVRVDLGWLDPNPNRGEHREEIVTNSGERRAGLHLPRWQLSSHSWWWPRGRCKRERRRRRGCRRCREGCCPSCGRSPTGHETRGRQRSERAFGTSRIAIGRWREELKDKTKHWNCRLCFVFSCCQKSCMLNLKYF